MTTNNQSLPPLPYGDRFKDEKAFRVLGLGGGKILIEAWSDAVEAYGDARAAHARRVALEEAAKVRLTDIDLQVLAGSAFICELDTTMVAQQVRGMLTDKIKDMK